MAKKLLSKMQKKEFVREMVPTAIKIAKKQIAEEDNLNSGSNPAGAGSKLKSSR
jgi:hypothetical protein